MQCRVSVWEMSWIWARWPFFTPPPSLPNSSAFPAPCWLHLDVPPFQPPTLPLPGTLSSKMSQTKIFTFPLNHQISAFSHISSSCEWSHHIVVPLRTLPWLSFLKIWPVIASCGPYVLNSSWPGLPHCWVPPLGPGCHSPAPLPGMQAFSPLSVSHQHTPSPTPLADWFSWCPDLFQLPAAHSIKWKLASLRLKPFLEHPQSTIPSFHVCLLSLPSHSLRTKQTGILALAEMHPCFSISEH